MNNKELKYFVITLLLSNAAIAESIKIGVENISYLPYYTTDSGIYSGFSHELFEMFADHSGHAIEYYPLPVARLFNDFLDGKIDFKFPDNPKWKQDLKEKYNIIYSHSVVNYTDGVFVKSENLNSNQIKTIGTVRGFTPWPLMEQISNKKIKLIENNDLPPLLKMLYLGRVDGVYANKAVGQYQLIKTNYSELIEFDKSLTNVSDSYYLSTISKNNIINDFNKFLKDNSERISSLKSKYLIDR